MQNTIMTYLFKYIWTYGDFMRDKKLYVYSCKY